MWTRTPDSHRVLRFCRPMARLFATCAFLKLGLTNRNCTGTAAFTGRDANCYNMVNIGKWRSREDLHLEPPPSHGGMQISCTSGAGKHWHSFALHAGAAPASAA